MPKRQDFNFGWYAISVEERNRKKIQGRSLSSCSNDTKRVNGRLAKEYLASLANLHFGYVRMGLSDLAGFNNKICTNMNDLVPSKKKSLLSSLKQLA